MDNRYIDYTIIFIMENLNIKVRGDKVCIEYTSLEDADESFYEKFNLMDYQEKINAFKRNKRVELEGEGGRLSLACIGGKTQMTYSRPGRDTCIESRNLCRKFLM